MRFVQYAIVVHKDENLEAFYIQIGIKCNFYLIYKAIKHSPSFLHTKNICLGEFMQKTQVSNQDYRHCSYEPNDYFLYEILFQLKMLHDTAQLPTDNNMNVCMIL